jgi:photosystem II stability/assembly factor-like uncharacterized protein
MPDTWPDDELPPPPSRPALVRVATVPPPPAIDGYEVGELVGRGGMAVVYRARQRSLNRPVALKVLLVGPYADAGEQTRVRSEAEAIARLQHPNVVHVYEVGERDGLPYLLMEFVDGGTLADRVRAGPVPAVQAAEWTEAIARGVHAAHRRGIVHRDLKPANVLMTADGVPKITDFGIARRLDDPTDRTRTGLVLGTPQYMAPEQAEGKKGVGPAADVWAVGAILYELLTGRPPFDGDSSLVVLRQVGFEAPTPPSRVRPGIPSRLEAICLKCLQKEPAARYTTAEALADDLAGARAELNRPAAYTQTSARRWVLAVAGVAAAVFLIGLAVKFANKPENGPGNDPPTPMGQPEAGAPSPAIAGVTPGNQGPAADPADIGEPQWETFRIADNEESFEQVAFPTREIGFVASRTGVYRTDNGGRSWQRTWERASSGVYFLWFADTEHGWLGSDRLYQTTDGGKRWAVDPLPGTERLRGIRSLTVDSAGRGLVGGTAESGELTLFRRGSGADRWEKVDPASGLWGREKQPYRTWLVGGLAVAGEQDAWAVLFADSTTEAGAVLHSADGGATWTTVFRANTYLRHIHFADSRRGWLADTRGNLWQSADGGRTWVAQANPKRDVAVSCLAFPRSGEPFGLGPLLDGQTLRTLDGQTWRIDEIGFIDFTPSAAVVDPGRAYVLGRGGRIARYSDPRFKPRP